MEWLEKLLLGILSFFGLFLFYALGVLAPAAMIAERDCLRAGFPKAAVTWNLESYCLGTDGSVVPRVVSTQTLDKPKP